MEVNITKRIDTRDGRRFAKVIITPHGRIKPDWVEVDERQERHPEGAYYLDWTEDGLRKRIAVGSDATAAYNSLKKKQSELDAIARGLVVSDPVEEDTRQRLRAAKADFLEDIQLSRQRKTWLGYCLSLSYLTQCCSKTYVEDIDRKDLLRFVVFLRDEKELAPRTVHNKFAEVLTLGIAAKRLVGPKGHVFGNDASPEMIARARKKAIKAALEVDFRNALVESMPFPDGQFDVVLSTLMLHHLPGKLRSQCAAEVRRVLKPGGRLLAIDFGTAPGTKAIVAHFHRHGHINLAEMVTIFREAGLNVGDRGALGIGDLEYVVAVARCHEPSESFALMQERHDII